MEPSSHPTRSAILAHSLDLFADKGFQSSSMRTIAERVGITKSSIYSHFKNKQEILNTLLSLTGPFKINQFLEDQSYLKSLATKSLYMALSEFFEILTDFWFDPEDRKILRMLLTSQFQNESISKIFYDELFVKERNNFAMIFSKCATPVQHPDWHAEDLLDFTLRFRSEFFIFSRTVPDRHLVREKTEQKINRICEYVALLNQEVSWKL